MPIFEYACDECKSTFEMLVSRDEAASCPSCNSDRLTRQVSRFSAGASASSGGYESLPQYRGSGCGCTPSNCGCRN